MRAPSYFAAVLTLAFAAPAAAEAPPSLVPGPLRPVVLPPPEEPPPVVPDKRRAQAKPAPAPAPAPDHTAAVEPAKPTAPVPLEGAFRPGATGEKAAGRVLVRPGVAELRIEKLAVTPGRDLEVWLVAVDRLGNGDDLTDTKHVSLGRLKKTEGDQVYKVPPEIDLRVYRAVVVWSRRERLARAGALLSPQPVQQQARTKSPRKR